MNYNLKGCERLHVFVTITNKCFTFPTMSIWNMYLKVQWCYLYFNEKLEDFYYTSLEQYLLKVLIIFLELIKFT